MVSLICGSKKQSKRRNKTKQKQTHKDQTDGCQRAKGLGEGGWSYGNKR